jgi:ribosomal RNA-processing protein 12
MQAAARAAAVASNKGRAAAEDAIAAAVSDALHLLGALKSALPLMSATAAKAS